MQEIIIRKQPVRAQNLLTVVKQYTELAEKLKKSSASLRAVCCAVETELAHHSKAEAFLPHAITRMRQVLTHLDQLSEGCDHFAKELLCGTDYPWPTKTPPSKSVYDLKSENALKDVLEAQVQNLCAVLTSAQRWFKSPIVLAWMVADLSQAGSIFFKHISSDTQTQLSFTTGRDFNEM